MFGSVKSQEEPKIEEDEKIDSPEFKEDISVPPLNILNSLACEGILAVINSIATRCDVSRCESVGDVDDESLD